VSREQFMIAIWVKCATQGGNWETSDLPTVRPTVQHMANIACIFSQSGLRLARVISFYHDWSTTTGRCGL